MLLSKNRMSIIAITFTLFSQTILPADNIHFYRASHFSGEPRLDTPGFGSFDLHFGGGSTYKGRDNDYNKTSLLNLYGTHNMHALGAGVSGLDNTNALDTILINLAALPTNKKFGHLQFNGKFSTKECIFDGYQNFENGFYTHIHVPVRSVKISRISYTDLSPTDGTASSKTAPQWTAFLDNFSSILSRFNISTDRIHETGIGDFSVFGGWSHCSHKTKILDFIDIDGKIGVSFPTGKHRNIDKAFSIPLGYNVHWGLPAHFKLAFGALEWVTFGIDIGALFLLEKTKTVRLKTNEIQNGFIKLAKGTVRHDLGTIWNFNAFFKAERIVKGLSLLIGYSYNKKDTDELEPKDTTLFNKTTINSDTIFSNYRMQTMHFLIEYDFSKDKHDIGKKIGFFYNRIISGQRVFNTHTFSGYCGIMATWLY